MDVSAVAQAAAQIGSAQRAQQISIAGLRSSQLQAQSIASVLAQSAGNAAPAKPSQPPAAPPQQNGGGTPGGGNAGQARGALLNILV